MISEASAVSTGRSFEEKAYRSGNLLAIGNRDRERPCGCYGLEGKRRHLVGALVVILTHWSIFIHKFQPRTSRSCVRRSANANDLLYKDSSAQVLKFHSGRTGKVTESRDQRFQRRYATTLQLLHFLVCCPIRRVQWLTTGLRHK